MAPKSIAGSSRNDNRSSNYLRTNLRHLRLKHKKTLDEVADYLGLSGKSAYRAYEQGTSIPAIHVLLKLASYYDVSLDELVQQDLSKEQFVREGRDEKQYRVAVVPVKARAGYVSGFQDDFFIDGLKTISIPYKPYGIARAFEIDGDSMAPDVGHGSYIIGVRIDRAEFQSGRNYIIVSADGDVVYKTVILDGDELSLISRNPKFRAQRIKADRVLEMWRYFCQLDKKEDIE